MVVLYVGGERLGTWAEAEGLVPGVVAQGRVVEMRDEAGQPVGRIVSPEPICPWEPSLTHEEIDRRIAAGGGIPLAEFWKRMGVE